MHEQNPPCGTFPLYQVIAAIHNAPRILCAQALNPDPMWGYDQLRRNAYVVSGDRFEGSEMNTHHHGRDYGKFSACLKQKLAKDFPALAAEPMPDAAYWQAHNNGPFDAEKLQHLHDWLRQMESKYTAQLVVPLHYSAIKHALHDEENLDWAYFKSLNAGAGRKTGDSLSWKDRVADPRKAEKELATDERAPAEKGTASLRRLLKKSREKSVESPAL